MADAARELARGKTLTLVDGSTVQVVFTMYTLAVIEDEYGSIDAIDAAFAQGSKGQIIRLLMKLVLSALVDDQGREWDEDSLLKALPLETFNDTIEIIKESLVEGFQKSHGTPTKAAAKAAPKLAKRKNPSSSRGTTTSSSGVSTSSKRAQTSGV